MNDFIFDFDSAIPEFDIVVQHVSTEGGGGGQTIEVDSELSTTSNNPVKNKVITTALNGKVSASQLATVATSGSYNDLSNKPTIPSAPTIDVELSETSTNAVQNAVITNALGEKMTYPTGGVSGDVLQKTAGGAQWASIGTPSQEQIYQAVTAYIALHPDVLRPISPAVKAALLQIAEKVAYIDENGEDYYDALDAALNAVAVLQITAVYTQTGTVYDTDSLDSLKDDLVVTAYYDDGTTANVTSLCTLSGTLTEGTSTITATYSGKSATFDVTVTHAIVPREYTAYDYVYATSDANATNGAPSAEALSTRLFADLNNLIIDFDFMPVEAKTSATALIGGSNGTGNSNQVAFYSRTDTQRVSCFSHGTALAIEGISSVAVNSKTHVRLNPGSATPSTLTVGDQSTTGAWSATNAINSYIGICGTRGNSGGHWRKKGLGVGTLRVYDLTENLLGEYIPCVRNADNVIGIYDTVAKEFLTTSTVSYATIGNSNCRFAVGNLG